ncbi:hypothetical protein AN958_12882 [Leucoagaricus sp. SymC.cos]|nr:hypothetical protein AN958_12882 [Leucoagaricus sp. SymC.cos]
MSNSPYFIPIDLARRVTATLPARTSENMNSPSFHVMKLPVPTQDVGRLRHLVVEYCIQSQVTTHPGQAIWWTSYVVFAHPGTLTRGTGVYTEWSEFGTVSSQPAVGIISPRPSGILIADMSKGVLTCRGSDNNPSHGVVLRNVDLSGAETNLEIFAILITTITGMYDRKYQVHGQARLEYRIRDNR